MLTLPGARPAVTPASRNRTIIALSLSGVLSATLLTGCVTSSHADPPDGPASCAEELQQKTTTATRPRATPGQSIKVRAERMWDCHGKGPSEKLPPLKDQSVIWRQSGTEVELTRVDADPTSGLAQATIQVPATATPGPAKVWIGIAQPATITVLAG